MSKLYLIFWIFITLPLYIYPQGWFQQNSGTTNNLTDIKMLSVNNAVVTAYYPDCYGRIFRTTNAGASWSIVYTTAGALTSLFGVSFSNSNTGLVVGGLFNFLCLI